MAQKSVEESGELLADAPAQATAQMSLEETVGLLAEEPAQAMVQRSVEDSVELLAGTPASTSGPKKETTSEISLESEMGLLTAKRTALSLGAA